MTRELYETDEDAVVVDTETGEMTTYTRGTREPLYRGTDTDEAAASLEMTGEEFNALLMSDPVEN